jgi:hypothetical protein
MPLEIENLSPLVHPHNWLLYRVPLRRIGDDYTVFLGNGKSRMYTTESLPDCIKYKLTMVLASPDIELWDEGARWFGVHSLMQNNSAAHMNDIGWRASDTYFVVVIESKELDSLVGEVLYKEE